MKKSLLVCAAAVCICTGISQAEETIVPRFDLKRLFLEGNTILPAHEVSAILNKYTGSQRDFGTLQEAMDELEAAYRKRGYSMVTVILPEQELERGTVIINVLEPTVKEVVVDGNSHFSRQNVLNALPVLKVGQPPNTRELSQNLRAANENPARKLNIQFKSDKKETDLIAKIKVTDQKPWKVALTGDNTGNLQSGYYRMGLLLQHANLWGLDHLAALQYVTSPDHAEKVSIVSGSYRIPIYSIGDTIDLFGGYSDLDNGTSRISGTDLSISGKGIVAGTRYNLTLPRFGAYEHKLSAGMDYRLYDNTVRLVNQTQDISPDVVAHPFSLTYGNAWNSQLVSVEGYLGLLHNEPWGAQGEQADFEHIRSGAKADYWIMRYGFNKTVRPGADWIFRVSGNGQYTPDRLIPGEQFGMGGASSIRGYGEREEAFDAGFSGLFEIYSPDFGQIAHIPEKLKLRLLCFFDGGYGYNLRPQTQASEQIDNFLTSTGVGLRLGLWDYFSFGLDWGYAMNNSVSTVDTTRRGDHRIHFNGQLQF